MATAESPTAWTSRSRARRRGATDHCSPISCTSPFWRDRRPSEENAPRPLRTRPCQGRLRDLSKARPPIVRIRTWVDVHARMRADSGRSSARETRDRSSRGKFEPPAVPSQARHAAALNSTYSRPDYRSTSNLRQKYCETTSAHLTLLRADSHCYSRTKRRATADLLQIYCTTTTKDRVLNRRIGGSAADIRDMGELAGCNANHGRASSWHT